MKSRKRADTYEKWDPPAPSTIYVKIKNIPYETFKDRLNQGLVTTEIEQIRYRLEKRIYCCGVCSRYINEHCVPQNRRVDPEGICKSFLPKPEYTYLQERPDFMGELKVRHLAEVGDLLGGIPEAGAETGEGKQRGEAGKKKRGPSEWYEEGVSLYKAGRLRRAMEAFDKVLEEDPEHFGALFHRGSSFFKLKRDEEALEAFEKALELRPEHAGTWTNKGAVLLKMGRYRDSLEAFERSILINPIQKKGWDGKDAALERLRLSEESLEAYEEKLKNSPSDPETWLEKGKILSMLGKPEKALEAFEKALELDPENPETRYLEGKCLLEFGSGKKALFALEKATRLKPAYPEAWYEKAKAFLQLDNFRGAENAFKFAADLWEKSGEKRKAEIARSGILKISDLKK